MDLSIVTPVYSEEESLVELVNYCHNNILDYSSEAVLNLGFGDRQFNLIVQPSGDKFEVVIDGKPVKLEF